VTVPLSSKIEVNGPERDPVYQAMVDVTDENGYSGDIRWNFEKFVVAPDGRVTARFHHKTVPNAVRVREAIEAVLPTPR
jgi:glutathione peroxidase